MAKLYINEKIKRDISMQKFTAISPSIWAGAFMRDSM